MKTSETIQVKYTYISSLVCEAVDKALAEKGIETSWDKLDSVWLFQVEENRIDIRFNDGNDNTLASIEGKLKRFLPEGIAYPISIFAPGAFRTAYRFEYGFEAEVNNYRQRLAALLLK